MSTILRYQVRIEYAFDGTRPRRTHQWAVRDMTVPFGAGCYVATGMPNRQFAQDSLNRWIQRGMLPQMQISKR